MPFAKLAAKDFPTFKNPSVVLAAIVTVSISNNSIIVLIFDAPDRIPLIRLSIADSPIAEKLASIVSRALLHDVAIVSNAIVEFSAATTMPVM